MSLPNLKSCDLIPCNDRAAWLQERRKRLQASDSAGVLGESPYSSKVSIWADKTAPQAFDFTTERQSIGLALEEPICKLYSQKFGGKVHRWPDYTIAASKDEPWLGATPDAIVEDSARQGLGVMQIKTWSEFDRRAWDNGPPLHIQIQVQHEMLVTGLQWAVVPVLFGSNHLDRVYADRNERFIDAMLGVLRDLWTCVELRTMPEVDGSAATAAALARLHPNDDGSIAVLSPEADRLIEVWRRTKELKGRCEKRVDGIANELKAMIGDATYGVTPGGRSLSWKSQTRAEYVCKKSTFRVLRECKPPKQTDEAEIDFKVSGRRRIRKEVKQRLLAQNDRCRWCGCQLTLAKATVEHLVPLSRGGTSAESNLALACKRCNEERADNAALTIGGTKRG